MYAATRQEKTGLSITCDVHNAPTVRIMAVNPFTAELVLEAIPNTNAIPESVRNGPGIFVELFRDVDSRDSLVPETAQCVCNGISL